MLFRVSCIQVCIDRASSIRCAFESHSSSVSHLFNKAHHLCEELLLHSGQMSGRLKTALLGLFLPENLQLNVQKLYSLSPNRFKPPVQLGLREFITITVRQLTSINFYQQ